MSDLLAAEYRIFLQDRRTKQPRQDLTGMQMAGVWRRTKNATSSADVVIDVGGGCCDFYPRKNRDELVVQRIGDETKRVWVGPVTEVSRDPDLGTMTIDADDRSWWWSRRQAFQRQINLSGVDVADAWAAVRADQDRIGGAGLDVRTAPVGRVVDLAVDADDSIALTLGDYSDVQWTVAGSTLYGPGPTTDGDRTIGVLNTAKDWDTNGDGTGGPRVVDTADSTVSQVIVVGFNVVGRYPAVAADGDDGFHQARVDRPDLSRQKDVDVLAEQLWRRNTNGGVFLSTQTSTLRACGPWSVDDFVPGRRWRIEYDNACEDQTRTADVELSQLVVRFRSEQNRVVEYGAAVDMAPVGVAFPIEELTVS